MKPLIAQGLFSGRTWTTVGDDDVRDTHVAMGGKVAEGLAMFVVPSPAGGTEEAPYPGWHGLSAGNRVNCRCTAISVLAAPPPKVKPPRVSQRV